MSISVNTRLARLAQRIDALSLRERVILFASAALLMLALLDQLVLNPALSGQRERAARQLKQGTELAQLRAQVGALAQEHPQGNSDEDRLLTGVHAAQAQQKALTVQIAAARAGGHAPVRLPDLLSHALQRHPRLTLVQLASRAPQGPASGVAATELPTWQRAELSVAGSYADLSGFVQELERELPGLRWGELHLSTESSQPVMGLQVWLQGGAP